ncbi:hypothetical protein [Nocardioides sp.]|uniref:DUF7927 domain-containing protein n=1 Tax=Nocardioides sp. TaxID=35761 RepID=UPI0039E500B9
MRHEGRYARADRRALDARRSGTRAKRVATTAQLTVLTVAVLAVTTVMAPGALADPGHPGTPHQPTALFAEDFENGPAASSQLLSDYTGADQMTYSADPAWLSPSHCNGIVVDWDATPQQGYCDPASSQAQTYGALQRLSYALGVVGEAADPTRNAAVAAYTQVGDPGADEIEFATASPISLGNEGRFVTFGVDAAATNCFASAPLLRFYLRDEQDNRTAVTQQPINPCADGEQVTVPARAGHDAAVYAGRFVSDDSYLLRGGSFDIEMRNEQGSGVGNDGAFDNVRVLDVTPQLDVALEPASPSVEETATLTFTVTNTDELGAKRGWVFTDTLPAGLVVAAGAVGGSCDATTTAAEGGSTIAVADGSIEAGTESCTITVPVASADQAEATYRVCGTDLGGVVGLDLPGCAEVGFHRGAAVTAWTSVSGGDATLGAGDVLTYVVHVANTGGSAGAVDYYDDLTHLLDDAELIGSPNATGLQAALAGRFVHVTGELAAGATAEVTYQVRVKPDEQAGDDLIADFLAPAGAGGGPAATPPEPTCSETGSQPGCTLRAVGRLSVAKTTAASETPMRDGTVVTYTLILANAGRGPATVALTDDMSGILDDADLTQQPVVSGPGITVTDAGGRWSITGTLAAGETTTVAYQVTLKPADQRGDSTLQDGLSGTGVGGDAGATAACADCGTTGLPQVRVGVTAKPGPGVQVRAGEVVRYRVRLVNTGQAVGAVNLVDDLSDVLDDATLLGVPALTGGADLKVESGASGVLSIRGTLAPGQRATVTYAVKVGSRQLGNGELLNQVSNRDGGCSALAGGSCTAGHSTSGTSAGRSIETAGSSSSAAEGQLQAQADTVVFGGQDQASAATGTSGGSTGDGAAPQVEQAPEQFEHGDSCGVGCQAEPAAEAVTTRAVSAGSDRGGLLDASPALRWSLSAGLAGLFLLAALLRRRRQQR